jgi:hypothetical protein
MDAAAQAAFAAALLDPEADPPPGLAAPGHADVRRRFAVYRNNVVVSAIDALEARFPVCAALLGPEFFRATARAFLAERPPRSRILFHWGDELPRFLATFEPVARFPWLPDLAALEAARSLAFHAADAEPLAPEALARVSVDRLPAARLELHPSVVFLRSRFAVVSLWAAHQHVAPAEVEAELAGLDLARGEDALVWRAGEEVWVRAAPPGVHPFLEALGAGGTLGEAADRALEAAPVFDLPAALALLLGHGLAVRLHVDGAPR